VTLYHIAAVFLLMTSALSEENMTWICVRYSMEKME